MTLISNIFDWGEYLLNIASGVIAFIVRVIPADILIGGIAVMATILTFNFLVVWIKKKIPSASHRRNISKGNKALIKVKKLYHKGKTPEIYRYLRKDVSPYVFEEMVLTSFKRSGGRIKRSLSYSGDGGVDGEVKFNSKRHLIQSKKYSEYIKAEDVNRHIDICIRANSKGFFVHTGSTGGRSKNYVKNSPVRIISGDAMISLLAGTLDLNKFVSGR